MRGFSKLCFLYYFFLLVLYSAELDWEINSEIGLEIKEFHKKESYSYQKNTYSSFIKSEIFIDFKNDIEFLMEPYFRYDHHDKYRSLFNFKEYNFTYY